MKDNQVVQKIVTIEHELVDVAKRVIHSAGDPFSAVMHFLHQRPEGTSLPGYVAKGVLHEAFEQKERIPGLIQVLCEHVSEIIRHSNVIQIINEHPAAMKWGNYLIKKKDQVKFEITREQGRLVLRNIAGLYAVENGIEAALEKVIVKPPKLEVQLRLGIFTPQRVVDIV